METTNERHAHEVMELMLASGKTYSEASLWEEVKAAFGEEVRFHTCTLQGLTLGELVAFLWMRGKLGGTAEAFHFDPAGRCQH